MTAETVLPHKRHVAWWRKTLTSVQRALASTPETAAVFTPGGVPSVTYVGRDELGLEAQVSSALARRHAFVVVSGPTKCGKSVLCQRILGSCRQIVVQGGQIDSAEDFWRHVSHFLRLPNSVTITKTRTWSLRGLVEAVVGMPALIQKKLSADSTVGGQEADAETFSKVLILEAIAELRRQSAALVIEDFHYLDKTTQRSVVRSLKSAVFDGLQTVILAVPHRAFDPSDVEAEVEGRVHHVEIPRWSEDDLLKIAEKGFDALGLTIPASVQRRICEDGFGNPLLVQEICFEVSEARRSLAPNAPPMDSRDLARVYDRLVARKGLARYDRLANTSTANGGAQLVALRRGGEEVFTVVLLSAVARLGPRPLTSYSEIRESFSALSRARPPTQRRIAAALSGMANVVSEDGAAPLEWLEARQELALTDPFLMFYMRWVLRDRRTLALGPTALESSIAIQAVAPSVEGDDPE